MLTIYTTRGDVGGFFIYPYIYSPTGEWIGWVTGDRLVFSVHGHCVGQLTGEPRVIRRREYDTSEARRVPPSPPPNVRAPIRVPLPPMMAELPTNYIDILDEMPELLPPMDAGELRDDMD